ncbi:rhodanese-like domain-containing protein [Sediminivirga luteola]|jgi:rhodanese-related sulfurtransferase|uniref:Rhodanese domain-containing protein n=1 Tax=Sediminivirga luteola TaxID=1774748 RepID=A0A8J2TUR8_9MICO|nr:rhodanese-like domain-containing protein [Sediminivirga luteola]MCI2266154.1 rhodanese-like domain-containing protein [Sediminivirga luteola]GGA01821.1 hypothetical protein GCM10011333_00380 [Sediminivirga luteola]
MAIAEVSPAELKAELDSGSVTLIDVREPDEHAAQAIPGARLVPMHDILSGTVQLPRDEPLVLHCKSGYRSGNVAEALSAAGYEQVRNLSGGIEAWAEAGLPVTSQR